MVKKPINSARDLEELLNDPSADAEPLTYTLLETITSGFEKRLGSGGYGDVYLGVLGNGKKVAVKGLVYTDADNVGIDELLRHEIDCFMRTKHHNVARLLGYCADIPRKMVLDTYGINSFTQSPKRYLCLEYAPNGDLQAYIEGSDGDDWTTYYYMVMGICQALEHIHKQHIIYLDLKPKNILLDAYMQVKITDFGVSKCFAEGQSIEIVECPIGTDGFKAPEMKSRNEVSYKSDIYALGVTVARLLMRKNTDTVKKWVEENTVDTNCPKEKRIFVDIARCCMKHDPSERITLPEIMVQLKEMGPNDLKIYDLEDVIKVYPQKMRFRPFVHKNAVSSPLNLVNRTGHYVACKVSTRDRAEEDGPGIIGPHETHTFDMPREGSETLRLQSTVVTKVINTTDFPADMFEMVVPGRRVYEVDVDIVVEAPPPEPTPLQGDTSSEDSIAPLDIYPSELQIPFAHNKYIPSLLHLTNRTNRFVRFILRDRYTWVLETMHGIVPPKSNYCLTVIVKKRKVPPKKKSEHHDTLILSSCLCDEDSLIYGDDRISDNERFFEHADNVHEVEIKAVYMARGEMTHEQIRHGMKIITIMRPTADWLESVEANPTEPWVAAVGYDQHTGASIASMMDYEANTQKPLSPTKYKERSYDFRPKFFTQKEWIIAPSPDEGYIDIYSYKMNEITTFKASSSVVKIVAVHPSKLSFLSTGKRGEIKLWEMDNHWKSTKTFVTELAIYQLDLVVFNPKNTKYNCFASAWDDHTIKFWDRGSSQCSHTLFGHEAKVNCLDFFTRDREDQRQYLITGSEDKTAKIWDIQIMTCVHTLDGFMSPVSCVFGHPFLPLLITGTEEGTIHVWSSTDFRLKNIFRIDGIPGSIVSIALACPVGSNRVVIGQLFALSIMDFGDEADITRKGQKEIETLKFGEQELKAGNDTTHSLPMSLCPPEKNNSLVQVQEPRVSRPSLESSSATALSATRSEGPTNLSAINEIHQLLSKVDTLLKKVSTTGERLSRISRILPPGRGPSAEAVQEATDYDVGALQSLKLATVYIRDSYVKLGNEQDAICWKFERKAIFRERQLADQDTVAADKANDKDYINQEFNDGESVEDNSDGETGEDSSGGETRQEVSDIDNDDNIVQRQLQSSD